MTDREKRLLEKFKALAEKGIGGEKIVAQNKLKELMKKLGITEEDLEINKTQEYHFKLKKHPLLNKLFCQILWNCIDIEKENTKGYQVNKNEWCIYLTPEQAIELKAKYEFYCNALEKDLETFYLSFIFANNLFPCGEEEEKLNGQEFLYLTTHGELQINSQRYNGFKNHLLNNNISSKKIHNITGNLEVNAMDELEKLLKTTKIDSIFCFSDLNAYELIEKLNELNYKVPEDINVIGYDNLQDYIPYPIKVSSIDNNKGEMIEKSLDILFDQINNGIYEEAKNKKISVKYQSGNTTKDY